MKTRPSLWFATLALATLGACTQFPELDSTVTPELAAAPYPDLVPVEPLLAQATAGRVDPVQTEAALQGRLSRLRVRAARLRGSVLTGRERQRRREGLR